MNARERTYATPLVAIRANATIAPTVSSGPVVGSFSASVVVSEFALDEGYGEDLFAVLLLDALDQHLIKAGGQRLDGLKR